VLLRNLMPALTIEVESEALLVTLLISIFLYPILWWGDRVQSKPNLKTAPVSS